MVCCWQFLHSAHLWADLIGASVRLEPPVAAAAPESDSADNAPGSSRRFSAANPNPSREDRKRAARNGSAETERGHWNRTQTDAADGSAVSVALEAAAEEEAEGDVKKLMDDPRVRRNPLRLLIYPLTELVLGSIQYTFNTPNTNMCSVLY